MTLHDAYLGLLRYWRLRPNGGTKAELLALAVQQGFEEPLLDQWLGVFVDHFARSKRIAVADYDTGLAPFVASVGLAAAEIAASEVYEYLLRAGRGLDRIKRIDYANALQAEIDTLNTEIAQLASARTKVQSLLVGADRIAARTAIDAASTLRSKRVENLTALKTEVLNG